jgi:hypothetical protein
LIQDIPCSDRLNLTLRFPLFHSQLPRLLKPCLLKRKGALLDLTAGVVTLCRPCPFPSPPLHGLGSKTFLLDPAPGALLYMVQTGTVTSASPFNRQACPTGTYVGLPQTRDRHGISAFVDENGTAAARSALLPFLGGGSLTPMEFTGT